MALTLIKEDGTGKSDANAYANAADGDAYHEGHCYATAWTGATTANKEKALVMATRLIDASYRFNGSKVSVSQALQWPRESAIDPDRGSVRLNVLANLPDVFFSATSVPKVVSDATCEMARELLIADRTGAPAGEGIAKMTDGSGVSTTYDKADRRPVISQVAQTMLSKLGSLISRTAGVAQLVRT